VHLITPSRGVRRSGRPGAVTLAALGVCAGTVAVASPVPAPTVTAQTAVLAGLSRAGAARPMSTHPYLWSNRTVTHVGEPIKLTGKVYYGSRAVRVTSKLIHLQRRSGTTWRTVSVKRLSRNGYVAFTVKPTTSVSYRLYLPSLAQGGGRLAASVSAVDRMTVKPWPTTAKGARIVAAAAKQTGKPYRYGAAGPNAFDCSGLTQYVYRQFGVRVPHSANAQKAYGRLVTRAAARPGDLIIFLRGGRGYHAGIYAGAGYMYDAPHAGARVGRHKIWSSNVVFRRPA
jgi:cell wall-associated NlpC family hydrolase